MRCIALVVGLMSVSALAQDSTRPAPRAWTFEFEQGWSLGTAFETRTTTMNGVDLTKGLETPLFQVAANTRVVPTRIPAPTIPAPRPVRR